MITTRNDGDDSLILEHLLNSMCGLLRIMLFIPLLFCGLGFASECLTASVDPLTKSHSWTMGV